MKRPTLCLVGGLLLFAMIIPAKSMAAANYYEGQVISFIVGNPPGGGYDRIARLLARYLPKYIAGKPTIVVQNMPGAVSVLAANHVYNLAKPDGLTIATLDRSIIFGQLLKVEGIKFDLSKFSWLGSPTIESTVLVIRNDLPYKTFDDLKNSKKPIFLGGQSPTAISTQFAMILKEYCGVNITHVEYRGMAEVWLAMERKEVDGLADAYFNLKLRIDKGDVRPLLRARISQAGVENLPVNEDYTNDPMGKKIMAMHANMGGFGRPVVAPPGTPANLMTVLRSAFRKTITEDQEFKEDAKKLQMDFEFVPPERCLEAVNSILNQPPEVVKEFNRFVKF